MEEAKSFGETIKSLRTAKGLTLKEAADFLGIDLSTLGKLEKNQRTANRQVIEKLAELYQVDAKELLVSFLSDRVVYELKDEDLAAEALKVAEQKVIYRKKQ